MIKISPFDKLNRLFQKEASPPFVIAELSGNHQGSFEQAKLLIDAAAKAGADAIKLQTYTADTMTLPLSEGEFSVNDESSLWSGSCLYDLYQKAHTPWEWHAPLFDYAKSIGLVAFSSPFDGSAVEFLEALDVPLYKIASFEIIDLGLLKKIGSTRKPVIVSTGMASLAEIEEAVSTLRRAGAGPICLLKCTSRYPASPEHTHLTTMVAMKEIFRCPVGLSDHTLGVGVAIAAVALGATVVEKHLVLDRNSTAVDAGFSADPQELALLTEGCRQAWEALGTVTFGGNADDESEKVYRRSLYVAKDIEPGELLTSENLRSIRPGYGLPPKYFEMLLGAKVNATLKAGTPLSWEHVLDRNRNSIK